MRKNSFVMGLDIGTTKICAVIGKEGGNGGVDIIGIGTAPSMGLRKGMVISLEKTVNSIEKAVERAEEAAGVEAEKAFAGIAGGHIMGLHSRGSIILSEKGRRIGRGDVDRVINAAKAVAIPLDREVVHVLPQEFVIDGQCGIKDPVGMSGVRLEAEVHMVTAAVTSAQNIIRCTNQAGFEVEDIVLQPLASGEAVLTPDERSLGVALLDIGGGTTDIVVYIEDSVRHSQVLALGGDHLTNDLAIGLRTPIHYAEELKKSHGSALRSLLDGSERISIPTLGNGRYHQISQALICEITELRMEEILRLTRQTLEKAGLFELLATGVVITGGASLLKGLPQMAEKVFDLPVRIGEPGLGTTGLDGIGNLPIYSTGVGLVKYGLNYRKTKGGARFKGRNLFDKVAGRMREWFEEFF